MPKGVSYIKIGNSWLEVVTTIKLFENGRTVVIRNMGCKKVRKSGDDYVYQALDSCDLKIPFLPDIPEEIIPTEHQERLKISSRFPAYQAKKRESSFIGIRGLGFGIGRTNRSAHRTEVLSITTGFDLITNFGVANIDIGSDVSLIIGYTGTVVIGPHEIKYKINDVGNSNTHCYTGKCINIFDISISSKVINSKPQTPLIIFYQ